MKRSTLGLERALRRVWEASLRKKCTRLYDARTSERVRRRLSMEVAILRSRLSGERDPLGAMCAASSNDEEC